MKRSRFVGLARAIGAAGAAVFAVERGADDNKARLGKIPADPKVTS